MPTIIGGNPGKMREAAEEIGSLKNSYSQSVESIHEKIIELANYWQNDRYTALKTQFENKNYDELKELGKLIQEFSDGLDKASKGLDTISK